MINKIDKIKKAVVALDRLDRLLKSGSLSPISGRALLSSYMKNDPSQEMELIEKAITISQMFTSPFNKPDERVDGPIRFALTENNIPVGLCPEDCHVLLAGQTGSGKSMLLKLIVTQVLQFNKESKNVYPIS